jgi:uncharacterized protein (TIGR03083 family)
METQRLLDCLAADFIRLRDTAAKDLAAPVPSCPDWTVTDLVRHVAMVYLHKVEAMRQGAHPADWPPDLSAEEPIALLDRTYAALVGEFATRAPEDPTWTWYPPDQTVGFWIRRMAQETVIHRVDAELALGEGSSSIPDDLAVDGVDEVLTAFVAHGSREWHQYFAEALDDWGDRWLSVDANGAAWRVAVHPDGVTVTVGPTGSGAAATIRGEPVPLLLSFWNRGGTGEVVESGDAGMVENLRRLLTIATQ